MERLGLAAALLSSGLGGTAVVVTRFLAPVLDPITMGAFRFGGGFVVLALIAKLLRGHLPPRSDWLGVAALGALFFGLFPVLFNAALIYTTSARGALALSTLPLPTVAAGAVLRIERVTPRKLLGVAIATLGLTVALGSDAADAPVDAWRGDLLMLAAAGCMALYNVWSRPFIARNGAMSFAACGMMVGALILSTVSIVSGRALDLFQLDRPAMIAVIYLALIGGALIFFLWAIALGRTSPTLVAISVAVNPVTAAMLGSIILAERIGPSLIIGLAIIIAGIVVASRTEDHARRT